VRIRALIYDFDDTIVESERINDTLFCDLLRREYSLTLGPEELEGLYGLSWTRIFSWLAESRGIRDRDGIWRRFMEIKREYLRERSLRTARGIERMLSLPAAQAIVTGSTREEVAMMLANTRIRPDLFDLVLCDEDCEKGKPDPVGFLLALERLDIEAGEALVFEDSGAGIEAARRAGIPVAFVRELASRDCARLTDLRFDDFEEAYPWVSRRIARPPSLDSGGGAAMMTEDKETR